MRQVRCIPDTMALLHAHQNRQSRALRARSFVQCLLRAGSATRQIMPYLPKPSHIAYDERGNNAGASVCAGVCGERCHAP